MDHFTSFSGKIQFLLHYIGGEIIGANLMVAHDIGSGIAKSLASTPWF